MFTVLCVLTYLSSSYASIANTSCQNAEEGDVCAMLQSSRKLAQAVEHSDFDILGAGDCFSVLPRLQDLSDSAMMKICNKAFPKQSCDDARAILGDRPWSTHALRGACGSFGEMWQSWHRKVVAQGLESRRSISLMSIARTDEASLDKALMRKWPFGPDCPTLNGTNATNATKAPEKKAPPTVKPTQKPPAKPPQKPPS
mmetsp:Transcript_37994/g.60190  ORF Transcript_37994/g.60190 Transcript_37994/m.60190 type:complete len:199 (-) Transcript_37994:145-741(-)